MNTTILLAILPFVVLVDMIGIVGFTAVGFGPLVYNSVADATMNLVGNAAAAFTGLYLAILFILDFNLMPVVAQLFGGVFLIGCVFSVAVLKGIAYPWAAGLFCIALPILYMGWLRATVFEPRKVQPAEFLAPTGLTFMVAFLVITLVWLVFVFGTGRTWSEETKLWLTEENDRVYAYLWQDGNTTLNYSAHCSNSKNISAYRHSAQFPRALKSRVVMSKLPSKQHAPQLPMCGFCSGQAPLFSHFDPRMQREPPCNLVTALYAVLFINVSKRIVMVGPGVDPNTEVDSLPYLKQILKGSMLVIVLMLAAMYAAASYVSGAARLASEGQMATQLLKVMRSEWVRAIAVGCLNVLIPLMAVLDMARQCMRKFRGTAENKEDKFTSTGRRIADECSTWNWCGILTKVLLLGEVFVALLIGMKVTYVFFSWLNTVLGAANINFWMLSVLIFVIGLGMFLCPIVPGSAVYLFAGVVLGAQSQLPDRPGFAAGVAVVISSVAKHIACVGQYMIGYCAGQSVKVQQMVGVDQVGTRATEKILKQPGLSLGKVCILVAGPDFPTSMLCGILKLRIPQMLLGTTPVILVSIIPQVLVGALLTPLAWSLLNKHCLSV
eukprot:g27754.t1